MSIMIQNKGFTTTMFHDGTSRESSNIEWNADYDGENANIDLGISENGRKKHVLLQLDNSDLSRLLSFPSVKQSLESRLEEDFQRPVLLMNQKSRRRTRRKLRHYKKIKRKTNKKRTSRSFLDDLI